MTICKKKNIWFTFGKCVCTAARHLMAYKIQVLFFIKRHLKLPAAYLKHFFKAQNFNNCVSSK